MYKLNKYAQTKLKMIKKIDKVFKLRKYDEKIV